MLDFCSSLDLQAGLFRILGPRSAPRPWKSRTIRAAIRSREDRSPGGPVERPTCAPKRGRRAVQRGVWEAFRPKKVSKCVDRRAKRAGNVMCKLIIAYYKLTMRRAVGVALVSALAWRAWHTAMASVGTKEAPTMRSYSWCFFLASS